MGVVTSGESDRRTGRSSEIDKEEAKQESLWLMTSVDAYTTLLWCFYGLVEHRRGEEVADGTETEVPEVRSALLLFRKNPSNAI